MTTARYPVVYIDPNGRCWRTVFRGSPDTRYVLERGQDKRAHYAVRFWPSKRGYRVLDMRDAKNLMPDVRATFSRWVGHRWSDRIYPNEDAAVMHCMAILNSQPRLL